MEDTNNRHGIERRKIAPEELHNYLERKSAFRVDYRQRLDLFAKTVLLTAGGALTISMSLFIKEDAPVLLPEQLSQLKWTWLSLLYTLASFSTGMFLILLQGFYVNKNWENKMPLSDDQISGNVFMSTFRSTIMVLGVTGFAAFIIGLASLGIVATEVIELSAANKPI